MPEDTFYVEGIQIAKRGVAMDIQKYLPDLLQTQFIETFKAEPKPTAVAPAPAPVPTPAPEPAPEAPAPAEPEPAPAEAPAEEKKE